MKRNQQELEQVLIAWTIARVMRPQTSSESARDVQ